MRILVTGGCGFIGTHLVRTLVSDPNKQVVNIDALTYAANPKALDSCGKQKNYTFIQGSINDQNLLQQVFRQFDPEYILHLAAESHVDRSLQGSADFMHTNIMGTYTLLESIRLYASDNFCKIVHVSTDEVYGSLEKEDAAFTTHTPYQPNSPYSASKASSDLLVRAWGRSYGIPSLITHCSNNYGPYQHEEKLIPHMVSCALQERFLPLYSTGENIRDWIYVEDHVEALCLILKNGKNFATYNIGGNSEWSNKEVVHQICALLDEMVPRKSGGLYRELIKHVEDRPGHDFRYAIDNKEIYEQLHWAPRMSFEEGLRKTVAWYIGRYHERNHSSGR